MNKTISAAEGNKSLYGRVRGYQNKVFWHFIILGMHYIDDMKGTSLLVEQSSEEKFSM